MIEQIDDERARRALLAALRAVRRVARPGTEVTISHWWTRDGAAPQSVTVTAIV
jgi:hypothetical protein